MAQKRKFDVISGRRQEVAQERARVTRMTRLNLEGLEDFAENMMKVAQDTVNDPDTTPADKAMMVAAGSKLIPAVKTVVEMRQQVEAEVIHNACSGDVFPVRAKSPMQKLTDIERDQIIKDRAHRIGVDPASLYDHREDRVRLGYEPKKDAAYWEQYGSYLDPDSDDVQTLPALSDVNIHKVTSSSVAMIIIGTELLETQDARSAVWQEHAHDRAIQVSPNTSFAGPWLADEWPSDETIWPIIRDRFLRATNAMKGENCFPFFGTDCGCKVIDALDSVGNVFVSEGDMRDAFVLCNHCTTRPRDEQISRLMDRASHTDHFTVSDRKAPPIVGPGGLQQ